MRRIFPLQGYTLSMALLVLAAPALAQQAGAPIPIAARPQAVPDEPACDPNQLSFAVDSMSGYFNGMSHSGTLLVLRNLGQGTCIVRGRPEVRFLDAQRRPLGVVMRGMRGMHPGPVIPPVAVPGRAELTSEARWVSSDAYGAGNCVAPAFVELQVGQATLEASLSTHLCGPKDGPPLYSVTLFRRDPVYVPRTGSAAAADGK